ncbi:recombinase family protein [Frankia sp. AvcI1]|uniref:recombinase family protein n=1 Tax=Frankia sp. AvcI1 TaxID=573496 RepID=UPI0021192437|nr:recombinase family protein [Frankia sp. AvcI1]
MSDDLLPIPALPPAPPAPQRQPGWWWRLTHPRAARQARLLAAHHTWTTERARAAQIDLVRAGFHLGSIPFGYQPHRVTLPDAVGRPHRRVRLVVDPGPANVVAAIYRWRVDDRLSPRSIATRLHGLGSQFFTPGEPASGLPRPWTPTAISRILANPVYTGATVWGRTRGGQPVAPEHWIICPHAHQPIIDGRTFLHAQLLAPPGTTVLSPHLPPWEFPQNPPPDPGTGNSHLGAIA